MSSFDILSAFILEQIVHQPVKGQISIYRALADLSPDKEEAQAAARIADELELISSRQMELSFRASCRGNYRKKA